MSMLEGAGRASGEAPSGGPARVRLRILIFVVFGVIFLILPLGAGYMVDRTAARVDREYATNHHRHLHSIAHLSIVNGGEWMEEIAGELRGGAELPDSPADAYGAPDNPNIPELSWLAVASSGGELQQASGERPENAGSLQLAGPKSVNILEGDRVVYRLPLEAGGRYLTGVVKLPTDLEYFGGGQFRLVTTGVRGSGGEGSAGSGEQSLASEISAWDTRVRSTVEEPVSRAFTDVVEQQRLPILLFSFMIGMVLAYLVDLSLAHPLRAMTRQLSTRPENQPDLIEVVSPIAEVQQLSTRLNRVLLNRRERREELAQLRSTLERVRKRTGEIEEQSRQELKQLERDLRRVRERMRNSHRLLMEAPAGYFRCADDGVMLECNETFAELLDSTRDAVIEENLNELLRLEAESDLQLHSEINLRGSGELTVIKRDITGEGEPFQLHFLHFTEDHGPDSIEGFLVPESHGLIGVGERDPLPREVSRELPIPWLRVDSAGLIIRTNRKFREFVLGGDIRPGETSLETFLPTKSEFKDFLSSLRSYRTMLEVSLLNPDGNTRQRLAYARAVESSGGERSFELYFLPEPIRERDHRIWRERMTSFPLAYLETDPDGEILFLSSRGKSLLKCDPDEGRLNLDEIFPALWSELAEGRAPYDFRETVVPCKVPGGEGKRMIEAHVRRFPVSGEGEVNQAVLLDVTERHELAGENTELLEQYMETLELIPVAYMRVRGDGAILSVNRTACQVLGFTREELLNRESPEIFPERSDRGKIYRETIRNGKLSGRAARAKTRGGNMLPVTVTSRVFAEHERERETEIEVFLRVEAR